MSDMRLIRAAANALPLDDESVQTCVTSPPYWGLRSYAGEQEVEWADGTTHPLGLEPTPDLYVAHMVEVFREVRRVLRPDGTLWLNLGDSYAGASLGGGGGSFEGERPGWSVHRRNNLVGCLKPKDLVGIPWRVAFALQADGWYLRSDIIWSKPNPMPESVTDRPTKAHEYLFLLSKSERYFYDADAIREAHAGPLHHPGNRESFNDELSRNTRPERMDAVWGNPAGRNKRTVWTVATRPYSGAHFATYPPQLIEPCILAGSAPKACGVCGAPWERVTKRQGGERYATGKSAAKNGQGLATAFSGYSDGSRAPTFITTGWNPTCDHNDDTGRSTVLDPFNGSGTTGLVAVRHNRNYVGVDISDEYLDLARDRINGIQRGFDWGVA